MSRFLGALTVLAAAASLIACGGDRSSVAPGATVQVSGHVLDGDDNAVSGARVSFLYEGGAAETISDPAGAYAVMVPLIKPRLYAVVEKTGYEEGGIQVHDATHNITRDLRLHRILIVEAGQPVKLVRWWNDPICGYGPEESVSELPCRRVRVVSPFAGQLIVEPTYDGAAARDIRLQLAGQSEALPSLSTAVAEGSETLVTVLFWPGATDTTLTTSLLR